MTIAFYFSFFIFILVTFEGFIRWVIPSSQTKFRQRGILKYLIFWFWRDNFKFFIISFLSYLFLVFLMSHIFILFIFLFIYLYFFFIFLLVSKFFYPFVHMAVYDWPKSVLLSFCIRDPLGAFWSFVRIRETLKWQSINRMSLIVHCLRDTVAAST